MLRKILTHILTLFLLLLVAMPAEAGIVTWKQFQLASGYSPRALPKNPEKGTYSDGYTTIDYKFEGVKVVKVEDVIFSDYVSNIRAIKVTGVCHNGYVGLKGNVSFSGVAKGMGMAELVNAGKDEDNYEIDMAPYLKEEKEGEEFAKEVISAYTNAIKDKIIHGYGLINDAWEETSMDASDLPFKVSTHLVNPAVEVINTYVIAASDDNGSVAIYGTFVNLDYGNALSVIGVNVTDDTMAADEAGEVPWAIPAALIGAIGVGAAVVAARKGKSEEEDEENDEEEEEEDAQYELCVAKYFGDTLYVGGAPQQVYARVLKTTKHGTFLDMPLTQMIQISSPQYLRVVPRGLQGDFMVADVSVEGDRRQADYAVVSFSIGGNGSSYTNNVHFYIEYPSIEMEKGNIDVLAGDNRIYRFNFTVKAASLPKAVTVKPVEGFDIRCEQDGMDGYKWVAIIANETLPIEGNVIGKNGNKYTNRSRVEIEAELDGGVMLNDFFNITQYPDGLSVWTDEEDSGFMVIHTENEITEFERTHVRATYFEVRHASYNEQTMQAEVLILEGLQKVDREITCDERYTHLHEDFTYDVGHVRESFSIEPTHTLAMKELPYEAFINIEANVKGEIIPYDLPVLIYGQKPLPVDEWQKEFDSLNRTIKNFNLQDDPNVKRTLSMARSINAHDLNLIHRALLEEAVQFYEGEALRYQTIDKWLAAGEACCNVLEFCGDQAFSFLAKRWTGELGEAILSPLKKFFIEKLCGELIAHGLWDEKNQASRDAFEEGVVSNWAGTLYDIANKILENELDNTIKVFKAAGSGWTSVEHGKRQIGILVAGFALLNFVKHYNHDKDKSIRGSVFKSIIASLQDLTNLAVKKLIGQCLENYISKLSESATKGLSDWLGKMIKESDGLEKFLADSCKDLITKGTDATVESTVGEVFKNPLTVPVAGLITSIKGTQFVFQNAKGVIYYFKFSSVIDLGRFFFDVVTYPFRGIFDNPQPVIDADRIYKKRVG